MDFWNVMPHGEGFALLGAEHLSWLAISAAVMAGLCVIFRRAGPAGRRRWGVGISAALLALQGLRLALIVAQGRMDVYFLPLHFCALAVFIEAAYGLTGGRGPAGFGDVLYAACAPGALMALLFPDWTDYPAFCFLSQNSFIIHSLLVGYPAALIVCGEIRPDQRNLPRVFLFLLLLAAPMYVFDRLTGANYMFLSWPSPGSPLEWFSFLGRPGYILGYIPLMALLWAALYLPWAIWGQKETKHIKRK